jgi:SAM-dependent methyltransferase
MFAEDPSKLLVIKKSRLYNRALKREINVWRFHTNEADLDEAAFLKQNIVFKDKRLEIASNRDWLNFIGIFGNFEKGLILGGGNAMFETYLLDTGIVKTFENLDIVFKKEQNDKKFNLFADLNFVTLKENTYDIIIAKSILHHIINLEHLLIQVNRALKPDGIFIVFDYIGESKQQWKNDKIMFINDLLKIFNLEISKGAYDNFVPFESIRSEEIPGIIDQIFSESNKIIEYKWDYICSAAQNGLFHNQLRNNIILPDNVGTIVENCLKDFEKDAIKHNLIPTILFGVYKKNNNMFSLNVKKWDKNKIKQELELNFKNLPYNLFKKIKIVFKDYYNYLVS